MPAIKKIKNNSPFLPRHGWISFLKRTERDVIVSSCWRIKGSQPSVIIRIIWWQKIFRWNKTHLKHSMAMGRGRGGGGSPRNSHADVKTKYGKQISIKFLLEWVRLQSKVKVKDIRMFEKPSGEFLTLFVRSRLMNIHKEGSWCTFYFVSTKISTQFWISNEPLPYPSEPNPINVMIGLTCHSLPACTRHLMRF